MSHESDSARLEQLVNKRVDGVATAAERAELDRLVAERPELADELADLIAIKEVTDAMRDRICADAMIEPPRPRPATRRLLGASYALALLGAALMLGFAATRLVGDPTVPAAVRLGVALAGLGLLGLLGYALRVRLRGAGRDPYRRIDL